MLCNMEILRYEVRHSALRRALPGVLEDAALATEARAELAYCTQKLLELKARRKGFQSAISYLKANPRLGPGRDRRWDWSD